ncbi:nucleotidyl transferase AbiEii/AbiGii toxin family protein [Kocuria sp.]|uniref:nucleotidyl transferase AbiEii/AbiGii toxin family protein n=1 Tax=Kocuria sp. TaxID=1871328 RepID=UPI0026DEC4E1|nr:nucleotidyl transferase AbiEii/AbiGii toxin family protein [Kocuria sp.]MDO5618205.1 nucleotidyl transferase AbiEii/AbiGii toxin family protein [Kocuria sp.]
MNRLFTNGAEDWALLGGNALLIRTGGGRFTQDIDLARQGELPDQAALQDELQSYCQPQSEHDLWSFDIQGVVVHNSTDQYGYGTQAMKAKVISRLGTQIFESFSIDITQRRHVDSPVDLVPLRAVISDQAHGDLVSVPTIPVENHLADKICAMYERHGPEQKPSTRMRDLADIVRILQQLPFDAERLCTVLDREVGRRKMQLPSEIVAPGSNWATDFPNAAKDFAEYPVELRPVEASLEVAGQCLNQILAGDRRDGTWEPKSSLWVDQSGASEAEA